MMRSPGFRLLLEMLRSHEPLSLAFSRKPSAVRAKSPYSASVIRPPKPCPLIRIAEAERQFQLHLVGLDLKPKK